MFITAWVTWKVIGTFTHYKVRLMKVEYETSNAKKDLTSIKVRVFRIETKLDRLISYLITTKKIDKDAPG
jgi:hypothetical protein